MASWLDAYTIAARKQVALPKDWEGYLFEKRDGQGIGVTGMVPNGVVTRGPRKGEPNFRTADRTTKRTVFVPNAAARRAFDKLKRSDASPTPLPLAGRDRG